MGLVDTHTHLESFLRRGALPGALERAKVANLEALITIGTGPDDWELYRSLAREHRGFIHHTVGLHPCSVDEGWERAVGQIEAYWKDSDVPPVALGECGLDRFHLPKDEIQAEKILGWQRAAFAAQLEIVGRLACPVVVHSRGAFRECVEMIDASGVDWARTVFHCFTEGKMEMQELVRRGGFGSFTGILTYKTADAVREAAMSQGLDRFMVETDAPYLTPMPHRGKPNEPAYLRHTAEFAAKEVFRVGVEELETVTTATARRFFTLS
jgi:TatD DNase family protein